MAAFIKDRSNTTGDDSWKADGFINITLVKKDGKIMRVGALSLKDSNPDQKALRALLEADPSKVEKLGEKLVFNYQSATPKECAGFDL